MDKKAATPVAEHYEEIREDLENLKALNIQIDSVTCDGHRAILKAVRKVCKGQVIIQRCPLPLQIDNLNLILNPEKTTNHF